MATQTTHLGLTLPVGTENILRQTLNDNFTAIDTAFGEGPFSHNRKANTTVGAKSVAMGGNSVTASGQYSFAEGNETAAVGTSSHAEGRITVAAGNNSHAEGAYTYAEGDNSHSEGYNTRANGFATSALGRYNVYTTGDFSEWVAGTDYKRGDVVKYSNNIYVCKTANSDTTWNGNNWIRNNNLTKYVEIVGNGENFNGATWRSNARALDWNGNEYLRGDLYIGCDYKSENGIKVATINDLPDIGTDAEFDAMLADYYSVA